MKPPAKRGRPRKYFGDATRYGDRPTFTRLTAFHITLPVDRELRSLRRPDAYRAVGTALMPLLGRDDFRIVHIALEKHTIQLLVEATSDDALWNGIKSFSSGCAQRLNQAVDRRGRVFPHNYLARVLRTRDAAEAAVSLVLRGPSKLRADRLEHERWTLPGSPARSRLLLAAP